MGADAEGGENTGTGGSRCSGWGELKDMRRDRVREGRFACAAGEWEAIADSREGEGGANVGYGAAAAAAAGGAGG